MSWLVEGLGFTVYGQGSGFRYLKSASDVDLDVLAERGDELNMVRVYIDNTFKKQINGLKKHAGRKRRRVEHDAGVH